MGLKSDAAAAGRRLAERPMPSALRRPIVHAVCLAAAAAWLAPLAAGCAGGEMTPIKDAAEFQGMVVESGKPVLVDFYKGGCPTCIALDATMDQLAREYRGRVTVAKFMLMKPYFAVTAPELKERYDIAFFPTAVLFVNGQEKQRFVMHYNIDDYRKALNEAAAPPTTQSDVATAPEGL